MAKNVVTITATFSLPMGENRKAQEDKIREAQSRVKSVIEAVRDSADHKVSMGQTRPPA